MQAGYHLSQRWSATLATWTIAAFERVALFCEQRSTIIVVLFTILFWLVTCAIAGTKLLDFDEFATYYPAALPTARDTWNFFANGYDTHTPLASLAVRACLAVFGHNPIAIRLPVIFCYWLMCVCIYGFVSRHCGKLYGLAAMVFPSVCSVYFYATEARAYGIILGSTAAALLCWQRASEQDSRRVWWLTGLGIAVAISVCVHYLGILFLISIFAGESAKAITRKRVDWPVILVVVLCALPLLMFVPMANAGRQNYAGSYWSRPHLGDIENTYRSMLTLAFAPLLGALILWGIVAPLRTRSSAEVVKKLPAHEATAATVLALLPVYAMPVAYVIGSFVPRQIVYTLIGVTISLAFLAYRSSGGDRLLGTALVMVFMGWFALKAPATVRANILQSNGVLMRGAQPFEDTAWMSGIRDSGLPVAVTPAVFFLQLQHYAGSGIKERVFYPLSVADAIRYEGANTGDLFLEYLSRIVPIQVPSYETFVSANRHFLVCAETTNPTWLVRKLLDDGAAVRLMVRQGPYFLFDVRVKPN